MIGIILAAVALSAPCPLIPPHKHRAPHIRVTQSCVIPDRTIPVAPIEEIAAPQVVVRYVILSSAECDDDTRGASYPTYWGAIGGSIGGWSAPGSTVPRIGGIVPRAPPQPRREPTASHAAPEITADSAGLIMFAGTLLIILGVKRK